MEIKFKNKLILFCKILTLLINILIYLYTLGLLMFFYSWDDLMSYVNQIIFLLLIIFFILSFIFIYKFWHKLKILFIVPIISLSLSYILIQLYIYIG